MNVPHLKGDWNMILDVGDSKGWVKRELGFGHGGWATEKADG